MSQAWKSAPDVSRIANELIVQYHAHLIGIRIEYRFFFSEKRVGGITHLGSAEIIKGDKAYMASWFANENGEIVQPEAFREPEPFFMLSVWEKGWESLTISQKTALVDHELCHMGIEYDDSGESCLILNGHDIEEFNDIATRHGLWLPNRREFFEAIRKEQKPLIEFSSEAVEQALEKALK